MNWFALYVVLHLILVTGLAMNCSRLRITLKIANGDGDNPLMRRAIRAHLNAVEHVVIYGLAIAALHMQNAGGVLMAILVLGYALARVLHAIGMLQPSFTFRRIGAALFYVLEVVAVCALALTLF